MTKRIHKALEAVVPHVREGSQIFVLDNGSYHKFRVEGGKVAHTESHSSSHVEQGRGSLGRSGGKGAAVTACARRPGAGRGCGKGREKHGTTDERASEGSGALQAGASDAGGGAQGARGRSRPHRRGDG